MSAWLIPATVTVGGFGTKPGVLYKPEDEMVPTVVFPPVIPLTAQVTAVFGEPPTTALNCCI